MSKLQNISGLLVAINSDYTKDVVVTTKTTRAELTKMLQATEYALTEVLPRMEGYASKVEELEGDKQNLLERNSEMLHQVGKLNREVIELKDSIFNLEEQKEELEAKINNLAAELALENTRNKRAEHKVETLQATIDKLMNRSFFERLFNKQ
jgi:chromosome segregation ATPase